MKKAYQQPNVDVICFADVIVTSGGLPTFGDVGVTPGTGTPVTSGGTD